MDVFIFGVGRSGTTMLYSLCQSIYHHLYGDAYISSYEPYIWNPHLFNAPYDQTRKLFGKTSSISIEGIYTHLQTPMFVKEEPLPNTLNDVSLNDVFYDRFSEHSENTAPHLVKFIRANGRMNLFRRLNPKAKFILMIRNPVDLVNSVKHKFSFYGDDFYPSDFPRFCKELKEANLLTIDEERATWAEKQAEYCTQMNRAAIDFALSDTNTLIFEYDNFNFDKSASVERLCQFLKVPFEADFDEKVSSPTGPVTSSITLSEQEFISIVRFDASHDELCDRVGISRTKSSLDISHRYKGKCNNIDYDPSLDGLTTNPLRRMVRQKDHQLRELMHTLSRVNFNVR